MKYLPSYFTGFNCQLNELTEKLPPKISNNETFKDLIDKAKYYINTHGSDTPLQSDQPEENSSELTRKKYHKIKGNEDDEINKSTQDVDGAQGMSQNDENAGVAPQENTESSSNNAKEVIEQFEPGVYVTVLLHPDGTKIFKRVRFSKRRFNAQQAEEWWKTNKDKLPAKSAGGSSAPPPPAQENNEDPPS
ncbi:putative brevis radix (BRX) domain-containing protein [Helianthus anomalus]